MPQEHSALYTALIDAPTQRLDSKKLVEKIREVNLPAYKEGINFYDQMSDLLREANDAEFGIVSKLDEHGQWVRDATNAIPLAARISHDSPVIEANNTLLRCLSRLRAIDYAIAENAVKKAGANPIREKIRNKLVQLTANLMNQTTAGSLDNIKTREKEFDTFLIECLHEANLTTGCETPKDAEKLLFHYRNLSSLLVPARTMITLTFDKQANILQRETQYPVTTKSEEQKIAIKGLLEINPNPFREEKTGHNTRNIAAQQADRLFADLMAEDDRALPAQARKTHLVGAKNAFIVKNELIALQDNETIEAAASRQAEKEDVLWLARTGVPVYVGKGENYELTQKHTRENLEQIRETAKAKMGQSKLSMHLMCLNTYSPLENQAKMVTHLYDATRNRLDLHDDISYMPTNADGTFRVLDLAPSLTFAPGEKRPRGSAPLSKATRLDNVAAVMLKVAKEEDKLSVVNCASGQDRTGTAVEKTIQRWMEERYSAKKLATDTIQTVRAEGGNAAEITAHHVHGSPGMKKDSQARNFFSSYAAFDKPATREFYRNSAGSNKKNPVGNVDFLKKPSAAAVSEYQANLAAFIESLDKFKDNTSDERRQFHDKGIKLLTNIKEIAGESPKSLDAKSLSDLSMVLLRATRAMNDPADKATIRQLAGLSQVVSGKASSRWKALGSALLAFSCAALVVAGVLLAIPSGGSSLLLTVAGATGLATGAGIVAASALTGHVLRKTSSEKGLAKDITNFKSALTKIKENAEVSESSDASPEAPRQSK